MFVEKRKRGNQPDLIKKVIAVNGDACQYKGCKLNSKCARMEVHHIVERQHGGTDDISNLKLYCKGHHLMVHDKMDRNNMSLQGVNLSLGARVSETREQLIAANPQYKKQLTKMPPGSIVELRSDLIKRQNNRPQVGNIRNIKTKSPSQQRTVSITFDVNGQVEVKIQ